MYQQREFVWPERGAWNGASSSGESCEMTSSISFTFIDQNMNRAQWGFKRHSPGQTFNSMLLHPFGSAIFALRFELNAPFDGMTTT